MRRFKKGHILISAAVFTVLISLVSLSWSRVGAPASADWDEPPQSEAESAPSVPETANAELYAVGDNLIHGAIFNQAKDRGAGEYDFKFAYENIRDDILAADIAMINQETVISGSHEPSHYPRFCTPPEMLGALEWLGFDVANIATNHVLDKGESGLRAMLELFSGSRILTAGAFINETDSYSVRKLSRNGIIFSFIGVTYGTNGLELPKDSELFINLIQNETDVKRQIEAASASSDFVVVNVHWGSEYTHKPGQSQREYAEKLAEWGADIIIGHHPHVIQPIEKLVAEDGREVYVAYSLGNFISAQDEPARMLGAAIEFTVTKNFETGETFVSSISVSPTVTHFTYRAANIQVYPFDRYTKDLASVHGMKSKGFTYDYLVETFNEIMGEYSEIYNLKENYS